MPGGTKQGQLKSSAQLSYLKFIHHECRERVSLVRRDRRVSLVRLELSEPVGKSSVYEPSDETAGTKLTSCIVRVIIV